MTRGEERRAFRDTGLCSTSCLSWSSSVVSVADSSIPCVVCDSTDAMNPMSSWHPIDSSRSASSTTNSSSALFKSSFPRDTHFFTWAGVPITTSGTSASVILGVCGDESGAHGIPIHARMTGESVRDIWWVYRVSECGYVSCSECVDVCWIQVCGYVLCSECVDASC